LGYLIAFDVNHKINPDKRSKRESMVEAITANDLLSIEAKTFAPKSTKLAMFEAASFHPEKVLCSMTHKPSVEKRTYALVKIS